MEKYESKQVQIRRPAVQVYAVASDFTNFTPMVQDKVENWEATADRCSFRVKGFALSLEIAEKNPPETVKIISSEGSPLPFTFWLQLREMTPDDTRMKLTLHAELPMMVRMMIGGKLQEALDMMAQRIAESFNRL
ncbi:MAG: polyketide cyclase [Rikenellaceae bacterium]|jgi:uncharacterized membrane protein|nr:polyketide cyclase [Rikenellaceae bacterium]